MSYRLSCLALALSCSAFSLHAGENAKSVPPYSLKKRSTFTSVETEGRAPFWPIGWVKRGPASTATAPEQNTPRLQLDEKSFRVTSILLGAGTTPSLAVINGRAYSEGEFLRMPKSTATPATAAARIRVQRITDGSVILQHADQTLVASLVRPELSERKAEELLILDPDR
jgi:hypothetical protein